MDELTRDEIIDLIREALFQEIDVDIHSFDADKGFVRGYGADSLEVRQLEIVLEGKFTPYLDDAPSVLHTIFDKFSAADESTDLTANKIADAVEAAFKHKRTSLPKGPLDHATREKIANLRGYH